MSINRIIEIVSAIGSIVLGLFLTSVCTDRSILMASIIWIPYFLLALLLYRRTRTNAILGLFSIGLILGLLSFGYFPAISFINDKMFGYYGLDKVWMSGLIISFVVLFLSFWKLVRMPGEERVHLRIALSLCFIAPSVAMLSFYMSVFLYIIDIEPIRYYLCENMKWHVDVLWQSGYRYIFNSHIHIIIVSIGFAIGGFIMNLFVNGKSIWLVLVPAFLLWFWCTFISDIVGDSDYFFLEPYTGLKGINLLILNIIVVSMAWFTLSLAKRLSIHRAVYAIVGVIVIYPCLLPYLIYREIPVCDMVREQREIDKYDRMPISRYSTTDYSMQRRDPRSIIVAISEAGDLSINRMVLSAETFERIIRKVVSEQGSGVPLTLIVDYRCAFNNVWPWVDLIREAGVDDISFFAKSSKKDVLVTKIPFRTLNMDAVTNKTVVFNGVQCEYARLSDSLIPLELYDDKIVLNGKERDVSVFDKDLINIRNKLDGKYMVVMPSDNVSHARVLMIYDQLIKNGITNIVLSRRSDLIKPTILDY